ncbi:MAG: hypothetical protein Q4Q55_00700 [Methanobrevibacter sp.]|nr:hypothetical protein [Methanobrevibacter sp.]
MISISAVSAEDNGNFTLYSVENNASQPTFTDLANRIGDDDDVIYLEENYIYNSNVDKNCTDGISIDRTVTIDGKGYEIDCNNSRCIFVIESDNVTLKNITFVNCNRGGECIKWNGANGSVIDCNFMNHSSDFEIVHWRGINGNIVNCNFINNSVKSFGLILWDNSNGKLIDSNFINNNASVDGVVCWRAKGGLIDNCSFINNGDYNYSLNQAKIVLDYVWDCISVNPYANPMVRSMYFYNGGAISYKADEGIISNCYFVNNNAYDGGAIYLTGSNLSVLNCIFLNNSAVNNGGGICCLGGNLSLEDVIFDNNNANNSNEVYLKNNSNMLNALNVIVISNDSIKFIGRNGERNLTNLEELLNDSEIPDYLIDSFKNKEDHIKNILMKVYPAKVEYNKNLSRIAGNKDVVMYFGSSAYYKIQVYNKFGKLAKNQKVSFTINKKKFFRFTNQNGMISLKINEKPGKYVIAVRYGNVSVKNKITIKTTLVTKDLSKKVKKSAKFNVKVLNSKGKAFAKKVVKITFKGKTYKIKTNSKGIAMFNIPKNLKVGKYVIKASYNGLINSNKIIVKK